MTDEDVAKWRRAFLALAYSLLDHHAEIETASDVVEWCNEALEHVGIEEQQTVFIEGSFEIVEI